MVGERVEGVTRPFRSEPDNDGLIDEILPAVAGFAEDALNAEVQERDGLGKAKGGWVSQRELQESAVGSFPQPMIGALESKKVEGQICEAARPSTFAGPASGSTAGKWHSPKFRGWVSQPLAATI